MFPALMHESFGDLCMTCKNALKRAFLKIEKKHKKKTKQKSLSGFPQVFAGIYFAGHALMITV